MCRSFQCLVPICGLTDPCHISSVPPAQVLLAEQQSLLVKMNLLSPLEQEKSAFLHNSMYPLLEPRCLLQAVPNTAVPKDIIWQIKRFHKELKENMFFFSTLISPDC